MDEIILEARKLQYMYSDGTQALKDLSMKIPKGKTTAVLGGNGAGKSTLFLTFNGINKPTAGEVLFKGRPLDYTPKGLNELRRSIGIVFQDPDRQLFSASVFQDISFGPMNMKLPAGEVRRRVQSVMERTGIIHLKDKPTHALSFGQKKRAAIAGVLAMEPEVLILDEPTAGLDPMGVSGIMKLLAELQEELKLTVVISTHDIDIVPIYCDHAYVLGQGQLVMEGTPEDVLSEREKIRRSQLRLPRIGHLFEILEKRDGYVPEKAVLTIAEARRSLVKRMTGSTRTSGMEQQ